MQNRINHYSGATTMPVEEEVRMRAGGGATDYGGRGTCTGGAGGTVLVYCFSTPSKYVMSYAGGDRRGL